MRRALALGRGGDPRPRPLRRQALGAPQQLLGKHSGFVCFACQEGIDPAGYVGIDHKVQRFVAEAVGEVTGHRLDRETAFGIDGCSIPTFAVPLQKLAHGFAKLATGEGVGPERAKAFARLRAACAAEPFMVAGSGRFCTDVMGLFGERVFVKTGAEGVFCAALPGQGLGVASNASTAPRARAR